ncbi:MAG: Smr/MutS family protein [Bacillota bacterium]|jgi:polyphosphate kinase 2 (PPK2 family)|nr:Smr/MutS family protein [Bacillota bacterium]NLM08285.1 Smr/MutS family protein [Clostridiales Family XIII bacterium]
MAVIKVKEVNLEYGYPTAEIAVRNMVDQLMSCKRQGMRAVILIHGYGSSGTGGKIKQAVSQKLRDPSMVGIVRTTCPGERWVEKKRTMLNACPGLRDYESRISGNYGVTVVLLK